MIKKLMFALAIATGAMVAQADFLWWQVAPESGRTFQYAELFATNDGGATKTKLDEAGPVDGDENFVGTKVETASVDVSAYANSSPEYSFFVELINYSADLSTEASRDRGDMVSYSDLLSQGYITTPGVGLPTAPSPSAGGWDGGAGAGGSAVPEPTSGMLFLLGGALMALRRRRRA